MFNSLINNFKSLFKPVEIPSDYVHCPSCQGTGVEDVFANCLDCDGNGLIDPYEAALIKQKIKNQTE